MIKYTFKLSEKLETLADFVKPESNTWNQQRTKFFPKSRVLATSQQHLITAQTLYIVSFKSWILGHY